MTHQFPWLGRPQKVNMLQVYIPKFCVKGRSMPQHQLKLRALEWSQRWTEPCFKRSLPGILSQWCTQCWRSAQKGQVPRLMRPQVTLSESVRFSKAIVEMWHPALEAGLCSWAACWSFQAGCLRASRLEDVLWTDVFGTVQDLNKSCLVAAIVSNLESEFWSW